MKYYRKTSITNRDYEKKIIIYKEKLNELLLQLTED